jgi:hypothetical protein
MSVDYYPLNKAIRMMDLFDGRLEKYGVREHQTERTAPTRRCLTDGENFLWVYGDDSDENEPASFTEYAPGPNNALTILDAIIAEFDVEIGGVDDIDPRTAPARALERAICKLINKDFAHLSDAEIGWAFEGVMSRLQPVCK